jgi:hypothetical protein
MAIQRAKPLIKANLKFFLEDLFLRNGFYTNVSAGEIGINGNDISLMLPGDIVYSQPDAVSSIPNKVFQSAFKNWTHEDGIPSSESGVLPPTVASGVTVNGTFYAQATTVGAFAHGIDYPNGRVIFDTPLAGTPTVQADFSYKTVLVDGANVFENERKPILIETAYKDNPRATGVDIYPGVDSRTLPGVFIDILRRTNSGYELGTRNPVKDFFGVLHIWSRDEYTRDLIEDVISDEYRQVLLGIDFNTAPDPLLGHGFKNQAFPGYRALANQWGPHFWRRIYIEEMSPKKSTSLFEVERSRIEFNVRVYPNF